MNSEQKQESKELTYPLNKKIICSLCGNTFSSHSQKGKRYYRCQGYTNIKDWEKLPALEKLKHFIRLWYMETDLAEKIECAHTDIYSNGRRRALSDVENLIEKMQNKEV